jgi:hypothetical protein
MYFTRWNAICQIVSGENMKKRLRLSSRLQKKSGGSVNFQAGPPY